MEIRNTFFLHPGAVSNGLQLWVNIVKQLRISVQILIQGFPDTICAAVFHLLYQSLTYIVNGLFLLKSRSQFVDLIQIIRTQFIFCPF